VASPQKDRQTIRCGVPSLEGSRAQSADPRVFQTRPPAGGVGERREERESMCMCVCMHMRMGGIAFTMITAGAKGGGGSKEGDARYRVNVDAAACVHAGVQFARRRGM
jgi:hypothetical protein